MKNAYVHTKLQIFFVSPGHMAGQVTKQENVVRLNQGQ